MGSINGIQAGLLALLVALVVTVASAPAQLPYDPAIDSGCPAESVRPAPPLSVDAVEVSVLCLINRERTSRGLGPLIPNPALQTAAERHTRSMARRKFFSHISPRGASIADRIKATGYGRGTSSWRAGEIIIWGQFRTPRALVDAWMNSPRHRSRILRPGYTDAGVGAVYGQTPVRKRPGRFKRTRVPSVVMTVDFGYAIPRG